MEYYECPMISKLKRKEEPLISQVPIDDFTKMVEANFDYEFTGESKFYPYQFPKELENIDYQILVITGASGKGKSTLLKELKNHHYAKNEYNNTKAIVSNFNSCEEATERLSAVGLNSMPVWCRPRNVLSIGEGFRADLALNIENNVIFDEFTSTIDRNVAKSTCNSIQQYIRNNNIQKVVFCSCHKDYIPFLKPDIVIDLDLEKCFNCRNQCLGETLRSKSMNQQIKKFGACLGSITI